MNVIIEGPIPILFLNKGNKNGRIYPTEEVEKALKNLKEKELLLGVCDSPSYEGIDLTKVAFTTSIPYIKDDVLWIDRVNQLTTPLGIAFVELLKTPKLEICFRPVGTGFVTEDNKVTDYNITGIQLIPKNTDSFS